MIRRTCCKLICTKSTAAAVTTTTTTTTTMTNNTNISLDYLGLAKKIVFTHSFLDSATSSIFVNTHILPNNLP